MSTRTIRSTAISMKRSTPRPIISLWQPRLRACGPKLSAFRRTQLRGRDRLVQSHADDAGIVQAMARGDGDESARCMRAHMLNASNALMAYIAEQQLD